MSSYKKIIPDVFLSIALWFKTGDKRDYDRANTLIEQLSGYAESVVYEPTVLFSKRRSYYNRFPGMLHELHHLAGAIESSTLMPWRGAIVDLYDGLAVVNYQGRRRCLGGCGKTIDGLLGQGFLEDVQLIKFLFKTKVVIKMLGIEGDSLSWLENE